MNEPSTGTAEHRSPLDVVVESMERLGQSASAAAAQIHYGTLLATPESEQEYLLRRLNDIWKYGTNPGPADYAKVRNDRRKWDSHG